MKSYEYAKFLIEIKNGPQGFTVCELWYIGEDNCIYLDRMMYLYYSKREMLKRFKERNNIKGRVCIVQDDRYTR